MTVFILFENALPIADFGLRIFFVALKLLENYFKILQIFKITLAGFYFKFIFKQIYFCTFFVSNDIFFCVQWVATPGSWFSRPWLLAPGLALLVPPCPSGWVPGARIIIDTLCLLCQSPHRQPIYVTSSSSLSWSLRPPVFGDCGFWPGLKRNET